MLTLSPRWFALAILFLAPAPALAAAPDSGCGGNITCEFRFPTSGYERLQPEWLVNLPRQALWEARNEIMARRGYAFETPKATSFFGAKSYYRPLPRNVDLTPVELYNVEMIRAFEEGRGGVYFVGSKTPVAQNGATYVVVGMDPNGDGFLSVRGGPGGKFREIGRIYQSNRVAVIGSSGLWLHIRFAGGEGWSHSKYLSPARDVVTASSDTTVQIQIAGDNSRTNELKGDLSAISTQLADLSTQVAQRQTAADSSQVPAMRSTASNDVEALKTRIAALEEQRTEATQKLESYETPIKPENQNLQTDARRSSEQYQKIPYFVPGTKTEGEMWVEPEVGDDGLLRFNVNFIDPEADYQKIAKSIPLTPDEIGRLAVALSTVEEWNRTAAEKKIRKRYEKEAVCLPDARCKENPATGLVTRVVFQIDDDGATQTQLRTRQGTFERSFGFSMESTVVLRKYLDHVTTEGVNEFKAGSATKEDLDALFK